MLETMIPNIDKYRDHAKKVLAQPIPEHLIKQREGGKGPNGQPIMLDYVEGSTVIRKLNAAFDNMWSWDPYHFEIIQSQPKKITKRWNNSTRRMENLATPEYEEQAPVAHVVGRLTVPGFGSRVGFGSKTIVGGASEQESCFKAAATDALKKAATLFGIGLELYEDEPVDFEIYEDEEVAPTPQAPAMPARGGIQIPATTTPATVPAQQQASTPAVDMGQEVLAIQKFAKAIGVSGSAALGDYISEATSGTKSAWAEMNEDELPLLKEYLEGLANQLQEQMDRLGINDIGGLNPYIRDFSEGEIQTFENLNPTHLKTFIIYLERQ